MPGLPAADVTITERVVRSLLATTPWASATPVVKVAHGFDFETWCAGDVALRLPRRADAVERVREEQRWVNEATNLVTLETPRVLLQGSPTLEFPYPWSVVSFIEGDVGYRVAVEELHHAAGPLGEALSQLHHPAPPGAPRNPFRGVALMERRGSMAERLAHLSAGTAEPLRRHFERGCLATPDNRAPVWVHGDIHLGNVIFRHNRLVGLIDFSDLTAGDPATDLGGALFSLPMASHGAMWAAYGRDEESLRVRAFGWSALFAALHLSIGDEPYVTMAQRAIEWLSELD